MSASPVRPGHSVRTVFNWPPPASIARAAGWTNRFLPGHQSDCVDRREPAAATGLSPYAASPVSRTTARAAWAGGVHLLRNHEHPGGRTRVVCGTCVQVRVVLAGRGVLTT